MSRTRECIYEKIKALLVAEIFRADARYLQLFFGESIASPRMLADQGTTHSDENGTAAVGAESLPNGQILSADLVAHGRPSAQSKSALLAAAGATIFVYSNDPEFQAALEAAAEDEYAIRPIDDWSSLVAAVEGGDCKIALLDADALRGRVEWRISRLQTATPWSVVMIAASRERATDLMELLWQKRIHRLVLKPLGLGVTRILLESAVVRFRQLQNDKSNVASVTEAKQPLLSGFVGRLRGLNPQVIAIYAVLLIAVAVMAGVLLAPLPITSDDPAVVDAAVVNTAPADAPEVAAVPAETVEEPAVPVEPESEIVSQRLQLASLALAEGRVVSPEGDSALDYFAAALRIDPENTNAQAQLTGLLEQLFSEAEASLLSDALDSAAATLNHIRRVQPESSRLSFLDRQLENARIQRLEQPDALDFDLSTTLPVVAAIPSLSELDSLLTVAEVRLSNGQLMLPVGDSALDYLQRAAALSPDDPIILEFRPELAEAIAASALDVLESGDVDDAELRIEAARSLGAAPEPLAALDAEVAAIREAAAEEAVAARQAALLTDGRARLTSGQYFEPADDSAFFYLTSLSTENPGYPELDAAWQEFADGLESSAIEAIDSADWAAGESWLDQLLRVDPESERVAELRAELEAARLQEEFLTVVTPPSDLVLLDSEPPVYPADAVVSSTEGWVDLEFVLGRDGNVTDISVIAAEPVGEFEEAAMEALSTYRFEPFELDGRIYERRIGFRMRFALQ